MTNCYYNQAPARTLPAARASGFDICGRKEGKAFPCVRALAREFVGFVRAPAANLCLADDQHSVTLVSTETLMAKRELEFVFSLAAVSRPRRRQMPRLHRTDAGLFAAD